MPRFAANLTLMFTERPFSERFAAAAGAGFRGVEYLFPYDYKPQALAEHLAEHGLEQVLFNLPPGDWKAGERGLAAIPGRQAQFSSWRAWTLPWNTPARWDAAVCMPWVGPESDQDNLRISLKIISENTT